MGGAGERISCFSLVASPLTMSLPYPQRLYRLGDAEALHRYTLIPDHPEFTRARLNALHLSDVSELLVPVLWAYFVKMTCAQSGFYSLEIEESWEGGGGRERTVN